MNGTDCAPEADRRRLNMTVINDAIDYCRPGDLPCTREIENRYCGVVRSRLLGYQHEAQNFSKLLGEIVCTVTRPWITKDERCVTIISRKFLESAEIP